LGALLAASIMLGCAVDQEDLHRWETTLTGPERLTAVVLHDKYPHELRVQAALSLIRMKPRKGQHVGIPRLVQETLAQLQPDARAQILADLIPLMIEELKRPPPAVTQGGQPVPDPSFKFKDAAFLMLTYDKVQIITDQALKERLMAALTDWAMADFERRLTDNTQAYGMEQLLRHIGPSSVVQLPSRMTRDSRQLAKLADIVAKIGTKDTREAAGKALVEIATYVSSEEWRKTKLPELKEANRTAGFDPTEKQLDAQMAKFQEESVTRVFASMKKVGGPAVVDYCLKVAADDKQPGDRRQTALAAIEGHIDRKDQDQVKRLLAITTSKAPPVVLDQAYRRVQELPRSQVVGELYPVLANTDWQVRRLAGATILQMSKVEHIDEFLKELGDRATKNFNLPEAITYGAYLATLDNGDAKKALLPHMERGPVQARLAAISYWYEEGTKADVAAIEPYERDFQKIPACDEESGCDWTCLIGPGDKKEPKEIKTVGDFVTHCIKPKMLETDPAKKEKEKPAQRKKKDAPPDKLQDDGASGG
jgi:hypothetical protein